MKKTNKKEIKKDKNDKKKLNVAILVLSIIITIYYSILTIPYILNPIAYEGPIIIYTIIIIIPIILFICGIVKKRNSFLIGTIICQLLIILLVFAITPTPSDYYEEHWNVNTYHGD